MQQREFMPVAALLLLLFWGAAATAQQPQPAEFAVPPGLQGLTYTSSTSSSSSDNPEASSWSSNGLIRPVPAPPPAAEYSCFRAFHSLALGLTANTLGAGVELATPLSRSLNLRSAINFLSFAYPFSIDGIDYDAKLHFQSSAATVDWFPGHRAFHISPGILYAKNRMSALASVLPGMDFKLGDQPFLNSVDDPLTGTATVLFPHQIAPLLMLGFGNIIPRSGRHFSVPFEIGAAYTGAPTISVHLNGTACTTEGCASFASNPEAQSSLQKEITDLNEDLKRVPVYPIVSLGFAFHF